MSEQKYLNVEFRVMFNIPVDEDFDIDEFSEEDLKELASDYFFNQNGYDDADYLDFEFEI
ncbi:MAG: hypothetical protein E6446_01900 [Gemella haemolysans]|nr:hypothetical protein [Gemella haemolysans]